MSESGTLMYAESLPNIRQISIVAALATPSDGSTTAELSDTGQQVFLHHDGTTTTLNLPDQVASQSQLQTVALGSRELSWRLPLIGAVTRVDFDSTQSNDAPWSAKDLRGFTGIACRDCGVVIVEAGTVQDWRDMPSESWAEMMDFWHCHKPTDSGANSGSIRDDEVASKKGYDANTKFRAYAGVAFVDCTSFLLASTDCISLQSFPNSLGSQENQTLCCVHCHSNVGYYDDESEGVRLYKWKLFMSPDSSLVGSASPIRQPSMPSIISSRLLAIIQSQCTSRLILYPVGWSPSAISSAPASTSDNNAYPDAFRPWQHTLMFLCIWSLVPSLRISSTNGEKIPRNSSSIQDSNSTSGALAMKVFWRTVSSCEAANLMEDASFEQLSLPLETITQLGFSLEESARLLPPSMRKFKEWDTGLLERYKEKS